MDDASRNKSIQAGITRARSFRSGGHWDASTRDLINSWRAADAKVGKATSPDLVFLASLTRELCALVLRDRRVGGPWNA
jgi:hypothetical protein